MMFESEVDTLTKPAVDAGAAAGVAAAGAALPAADASPPPLPPPSSRATVIVKCSDELPATAGSGRLRHLKYSTSDARLLRVQRCRLRGGGAAGDGDSLD